MSKMKIKNHKKVDKFLRKRKRENCKIFLQKMQMQKVQFQNRMRK